MSIEDQTNYTKEIGEFYMKNEIKEVLVQQQIDNVCKLLDGNVEYVHYVDPKKTCKKIVITYDTQQSTQRN